MTEVSRRFVETSAGTIHCAIAGEYGGTRGENTGTDGHRGTDVLLLHQTPRSWNEYREVLPLLGHRRRAIAIDMVGFGDSTALPEGSDSIERWAEVALDLLTALGVQQAHLVGHHTGAVVATEMAVRAPDRARSVVLSSAPFDAAQTRAAQLEAGAIVDNVTRRPDGSH